MLKLTILIAYFTCVFGVPPGRDYTQRGSLDKHWNGLHPNAPCAGIIITEQSMGRIVNHPNHRNADHSLEASASSSIQDTVYINGNKDKLEGQHANIYRQSPSLALTTNNQQNTLSETAPYRNNDPTIAFSSTAGAEFNNYATSTIQYQNLPPATHLHHQNAVFPVLHNNYQLHSFKSTETVPLPDESNRYTQINNIKHDSANIYQHNFASQLGQKLQQHGQLGQIIHETFASTQLDPSAEKHIYVHVPPQDFEESNNLQQIVNLSPLPQKKHYKIIFIKTPTAAPPNYKQQLEALQQSEEKTLIYVLVKKPDEPTLEEIENLQDFTHNSDKPEVYFIKYKTSSETKDQPVATTSPIELKPLSESQISDGSDSIDIRSSIGESGSTGLPNSYLAPASSVSFDEHSSYGVPLN